MKLDSLDRRLKDLERQHAETCEIQPPLVWMRSPLSLELRLFN